MRSTLVAPDNIAFIWPAIEGFIHSAFTKHEGDDTEETALAMLERREAQLWVAHSGSGIRGAAITRIATVQSGRKVCFCIACGGTNFEEWEFTLGDIEKFAKANHCDAVRITGRAGWRVYKKRGYKEPFVVLEKVL